MVYSDVLENITGKHWVLRSSAPIELSPLGDAPPFPREMISITRLPGAVVVETAVGLLRKMMEPLLWEGSIRHMLPNRHRDCAVVEVSGNPLTGPILFIVRTFRSSLETILLIYEMRGEERPGERGTLLEAVIQLPPPNASDQAIGQVQRAPTSSEEQPLPELFDALGTQPIAGKLRSALQETNLLHRDVLLLTFAVDVLCAPAFVETLQSGAFADLVRVLEGINATFTRTKSDAAAMFAASLLARALLLNSASNATALERALRLSALLIDKASGVSQERWEEALFTNLFARASAAVKRGDEDYGDLEEIAKALSSDKGVAHRVVTRLVNDDTFIRALKGRVFSEVRLARCDIALAVMQQMLLDSSSLTGGMQEGSHRTNFSEFLEIYQSLPREFRLTPTETSSSSQLRFFEIVIATYLLSLRELELLYEIVDAKKLTASVRQYVAALDSGKRGPRFLLFLRGFRSSKRIWMDNRFSFARQEIIPFPEEPARLSIEAALNKGLGVQFETLAIGGLADPLGMSRLSSLLDPDSWRKAFNHFSDSAAVILVLPDYSGALTWELTQLIDCGYLGRVVLLMTPISLDVKAADAWVHVANVFREHEINLMPYNDDGCFVVLSSSGVASEVLKFSTLLDGSLAARLSELFGGRAKALFQSLNTT